MSPRHTNRRSALPAVFASIILMSSLLTLASSRGAIATPLAASENDGSSAEAGVPEGTDVWLLDLSKEGEVLRAGEPRNLTQRPGYDNQPYFSPTMRFSS